MSPKGLSGPAGFAQAGLQALLEAVGDAACIKDEALRYVAVNADFARLIGREREAILGKTDRDLFPAELAQRYETEDRRALSQGSLATPPEGFSRPDGQKVTLAIDRRAIRVENGAPAGLIGIARDVTEQRELEQRLIQSHKMDAVGRLAGGVAHDFNNLLTAIQGYSALLLTELPAGDARRKHAEEILKAGERATTLTRQLLAFSRRQVLEPRVLDLEETIQNISRMLVRVLGENIELATSSAPQLWRVLADPGQIEHVVVNLASNARHAMPHGGKLTIETRNEQLGGTHWRKDFPVEPGDYVLLTVTDTGVGIPPEIQSRLFEPFFTTKPRGQGAGLGLSTVYGIVKQSGGYIWVSSEPGRGSAFKIYLPRVDAPVSPAERSRSAASGLGSETILLVEDEQEVRALVEKLLRLQGYTVIATADPTNAISAAATSPGRIDLLVTDILLPGLSGRDVAQQVQRLRPGIPVLYVSGYSDEAVAGHGVLDPGTHFLQKPFTPGQLSKKIREILDRR